MTRTSISQQVLIREDLQPGLTSGVMSNSDLDILVAAAIANDLDDFKFYAQELDSSLDEQSDYEDLSFSIGAWRCCANQVRRSVRPLPPEFR